MNHTVLAALKKHPGVVRKLRRVQNRLLKNPTKYDQGEWCGTACCIAGHYALESGARMRKVTYPHIHAPVYRFFKNNKQIDAAGIIRRELLAGDTCDLNLTGSVNYWPESIRKAYLDATTPTELAAAGAARIDWFLTMGE